MASRTRKRTPPLALRATRLAFSTLGPVFPGLMSRVMYRLWFTTQRVPEPAREARLLESAWRGTIDHDGGALAVMGWGARNPGTAPAVVLVHGWSGRGAQLGAFAAPLVAAGYRVVAFDAPAHGRSSGHRTTIFRIAAALAEVNRIFGPFTGALGHSFGVPVIGLALAQGQISVERVVAISPPLNARGLVAKFGRGIHAPAEVQRRFGLRLEAGFGADIWQRVSLEHLAPQLTAKALVIHDDEDSGVPWQEGERVAALWPGAEFWRTAGLGHLRILRNREVIERAATFLGASPAQ
jgi:pimeloyl-ACP methyl ester carboxylesterase